MIYHKCLCIVIFTLISTISSHGTESSDDVIQRLMHLENVVGGLVRDRDDSDRRLQEVEASARQHKSHLENEMANVQSELSTLQQKYQDLARQLETSSSKSVRSTSEAKFAFSASLSNRMSKFNRDEKIIMDNVLTNDGNGYDPLTGVFTCHVPGTYVFHVTIQVEDGHSFGAEIVKNGQEIAWVLAEPMRSRASASTSVIVNLAIGDTVFVRSDGYFDQQSASIDDQFTSFSGFLIEVGEWISFGSG
ncbi:C1q-related factor-like [Mizuhopecten yessoensis]|uniref:C1q-related factor n=1 Tax=Mizuhopecten yessoensis TaxID=6573 RepID=A0A210PVU7_MIZYE|nr:C1q-related factor-like [Mizuhopecten yessoensis]OWF40610.1 C1q-related factor [Mizuhopecten yessoensis]